jgi:hypothetical protein
MMIKRLMMPAFWAIGLISLPAALAQEARQDNTSPQVATTQENTVDQSWNQGSWEGGLMPATQPSAAAGAQEDRWWDWKGGDQDVAQEDWWFEDEQEATPPTQRWCDPGAIPGPSAENGEDSMWSQGGPPCKQDWGYVSPEPSARWRHPYSYGTDGWSDTNRYDRQAEFVNWWDS